MHFRSFSHGTVRATLALGLSAVLLPMVGGPAHAELQPPPGPVDPATGFPAYYTDTTGLSLQPCLDGPPLCLGNAADLLDNGADGEGFYYSATAEAGGITVGLDLEAAYFDVGPDQEVVFARTQYSARPGDLVANAQYTVTDPYGSRTCTSNGAGAIPNNACRTDEGAAGPQDFTGALGGRIGPFLTWDTLGAPTGAPPAGYIGDGATEHAVTGSPTGFNTFRVQGPGIDTTCVDGLDIIENCAQTDLFIVSGKIAPGPAAVIQPAEWDFGNVSAAATRTFTYSSIGTQSAVVGTVSTTGPFSIDSTTCTGATLAPGATCTFTVRFTPVAGQSSSGSVSVSDNTPASPRSVPVTGRSVPVASTSPASLAFGDRNIAAGPSAPLNITVNNTGAAPLHVTAGSASNPAFAVDVASCASVPAGSSCTAAVTFDPSATGNASGTVNLTTDGGNKSVPVSGRGVQSGIQSDNNVDFGNVAVGETEHQVLQVTNNGTAPLDLTALTLGGTSAASYALEDPGVAECDISTPVPPGGQCDVGLAYTPTGLGADDATLTLSRADGADRVVTLTGNGVDGVPPRVLRRSPAPGASAVRPGSNVLVVTSEAVTGVRGATFFLVNLSTGSRVRATLSQPSASRAVLNPRGPLPRDTRFRARLVGGAGGVHDLSGLPLRTVSWQFRTR